MEILIYSLLIYNLIGIFLFSFAIIRIKKINSYKVIKIYRQYKESMIVNIPKKGIYAVWTSGSSKFRSVNIFDFSILNKLKRKYTNIYYSIYPYQHFKLKSRIEIGTFRVNKGVYGIIFKSKKNSELLYIYISTGKSYFYKVLSFVMLILGFLIILSGTLYLFSSLIFLFSI